MTGLSVWDGAKWVPASDGGGQPAGYVRPADWLPLPALTVGEQRVVGLVAVFDDDSNFISLAVAGAYTVDWGDGSAPQNFATNVKADHKYNFADLPSSTLTTRGYRQAIVSITPQAGQNLTTLDFNRRHNTLGSVTTAFNDWLDIKGVGDKLSALTVGASSMQANPRMLEQFEWVGPATIGSGFGAYLFGQGCAALARVEIPQVRFNASAVNSMFSSCASLTDLSALDMPSLTNVSSMFSGCSSLRSVPALNTANCTTFASMFNSCASLKSVPPLNTAKGTDFGSMFTGCSSIREVPPLNTSLGTVFTNMFSSCFSLQVVPLLDTSKGTALNGMFNGCLALREIPALNLSAATAAHSTITNQCYSLSRFQATGAKYGFTIPGQLSAAALNEVYSNLGPPNAGAQTLTVTGNFGVAGDNPALVPAGWTVTGS